MSTIRTASHNFGFLKRHDPRLEKLGALAEHFFRLDPNTTLIKVRQFGELLAGLVAAKTKQIPEERGTQLDLINLLSRNGVISGEVADAFHLIRMRGNKANHDLSGSHEEALSSLKFARALGVWFHRTFSDPEFDAGPFIPPPDPEDATGDLHAQLADLRRQLDESLSKAVKATRTAEEEARRRLSAEERAEKEAEERSTWESLAKEAEESRAELLDRMAALQAGQPADAAQNAQVRIAESLDIDEADTRELIDSQLESAGWRVDSRHLTYANGTRPDSKTPIAIAEWPTESGPVDYALFLEGRCVAVIEAKRQAKDVPGVLTQAKRYARDIALEKDQLEQDAPFAHGLDAFRVPFVFATNGRPFVKQYPEKSGIWFWDARSETNRDRALAEWFSPRDIRAKLEQEVATSVEGLRDEPFDYANLYPFQQEAVTAIEKAISEGQREILIAMATGTGKTRTCIALMYRLLKHKRFRRILFLVDRRALAEQTLQALENTELEGLLKFDQMYNVAGLEKKTPEREDRLQIATVQSLVKRILYDDDKTGRLTPGMYDCIVVDEAHRGYTLDAEMREEDIEFRNTEDYLSKYRRVLDFFDATKIALTATPALHTREIFGHPVYRYGYRQAVIDGYLIDHQPPRRITTALNTAGISFEGGEEVQIIDSRTGQIDLFEVPDLLEFAVEQFNKRVHTREFNRVVCETIASEIGLDDPGKTLIFATRDDHADLIVEELKKALENEYGPIPHDLVQKITGTVDKPSDKIRRFRNDDRPQFVVTVDLLTTGVDIPKITNLVFVRRVNSRILYDQMIGRATRKCDEIGKEYFRIFDAVDIYANLQAMTDMRPVVTDPNITIAQLATDLRNAATEEDKAFVRDQIVVRARQKTRLMDDETREQFEHLSGDSPEDFVAWLRKADVAEVEGLFTDKPQLVQLLDKKRKSGDGASPIFISEHEDELIAVEDYFGKDLTPEDYIEAFERYVRENMNSVPGLIAATQRPRELTRKDLKALAVALDEKGFSETNLRRAYGKVRNADIAAHIIGFIRQAALGDPLVPYATRVDNAIAKIEREGSWTTRQKQWLRRLGRALKEQPVGDPELLDQGAFRLQGGFATIDRDFDNRLDAVLKDINDAIWGGTAA